jgi:glycosyltransferase involved in cell wall biosynthesis
MSPDPAITVIVPTWNRSHYLRDCLGSLARQRTTVSFEVLVIDNGSTDDTPHVIDDWCRRDSRFRTSREPRLGLSFAKNAGVRLADSELLMFADDDMIVDEQWIDSYRRVFAEQGTERALAGGPYVPIPNDLGAWPPWFDEAALPDVGLLDYREQRVLRPFEYVWGGNMAVPAGVFERIGLWDVSVGRRGEERGTFEDTEFQDRWRAAGGSVWFCPGAVMLHRIARKEITPRRVLMTAFSRGRNDFAQRRLHGSGSPDEVDGPSNLRAVAGLVIGLFKWLWWAAYFRVTSTQLSMERARRAAWGVGWTLDRGRFNRESSLFWRALARVTFAVRGLVRRLAPTSRSP